MRSKAKTLLRWLEGAIVPVLLLLAWEGAARWSTGVSEVMLWLGYSRHRIPDLSFLVPPSEVLPNLVRLLKTGEILADLWDTTWRTLLAFLVASFLGALLGMPLGLSRKAERIIYPTVDALRSLPPVALLPLMILFFGIEDRMKLVFICFGAAWPVVVSTAAAFASIEPMWIKVASNCGHSQLSTWWRVMLPAALPQVFPGLRICLALSLILSIVSEMLTGNSGLGHFLNYSKRSFEYSDMFATVVLIAALGWMLSAVFVRLDRGVLAWHHKQHGAAK